MCRIDNSISRFASYLRPAQRAGLSLTGFTLLEMLIVVVIIAIFSAIGIPIYTNTIEKQKGEMCKNNILMTIAAWKIYNIKSTTDFANVARSEDGFYNIAQINTNMATEIDERYFGDTSISTAGFYMLYDPGFTYSIRTDRLTGTYQNKRISCRYTISNNSYNWSPGGADWYTNWPF